MLLNHMPSGREACPLQGILERIGSKWSLLIIMQLSEGSLRFSELKRRIDGISQRMLTLTLRTLERDGLVGRTVTPTVPPRVDYELTELGQTLLPPVTGLLNWARVNLGVVEHARAKYDHDGNTSDLALPIMAKAG